MMSWTEKKCLKQGNDHLIDVGVPWKTRFPFCSNDGELGLSSAQHLPSVIFDIVFKQVEQKMSESTCEA